eukprot:GHVS01099944.1.p1 GENE.GHVS01099944.1~~GHVS01099944.1.p1  ORF type:complete len:236 (+),score=24.41 GHVS01099944.1:1256-1963(+)
MPREEPSEELYVVLSNNLPAFSVIKKQNEYTVTPVQDDAGQYTDTIFASLMNAISTKQDDSKNFTISADDLSSSRQYVSALMKNTTADWTLTVDRYEILNIIRGDDEKELPCNARLLNWPNKIRPTIQINKIDCLFALPLGWRLTSDRKDLWETTHTMSEATVVTFSVLLSSETLNLLTFLPFTLIDDKEKEREVIIDCDEKAEIRNNDTFNLCDAHGLIDGNVQGDLVVLTKTG